MTVINYTAPPTCAAFMKSNSFGRLIAGPVGSGKTTACLFELFRRACEQTPAGDGLRYTRMAIVRQTLKQLKDTVLKDITTWLEGVADYRVSENTIYIRAGDVRSEWLLIPLDTPEDQRRLLSMQLTMAWLSESIEMDVGLISPLGSAVVVGNFGRYYFPFFPVVVLLGVLGLDALWQLVGFFLVWSGCTGRGRALGAGGGQFQRRPGVGAGQRGP